MTVMAGVIPDDPLNPYNIFKLLVINCRGLKSKKDSFAHLIQSQSAHFIAGTEPWLNPTVSSSEIFSTDYQVFRSDRSDGYGGVSFTYQNTINCSQITTTKSCENITCKVELTNNEILSL